MKRSVVLPALAGVAFLTAIALPSTGWLVRLHLGGLRGVTVRTAIEAPLDPLPAATATGLAAALRRDGETVRPRVPEFWRISYNRPSAEYEEMPTPDPAAVRDFLARASGGARLEPDNGFFMAMAAMGRFAGGDAKAGVAELHRAALAPRWDDHFRDEVRLSVARYEARSGRLPAPTVALVNVEAPAATDAVRGLGRAAIAEAQRREVAGDTAGGMAIRRDLIALGRRLRDDRSDLPVALQGAALVGYGVARPGTERAVDGERGDPKVAAALDAQWRRWAKAQGASDLADVRVASNRRRDALRALIPRAAGGVAGLAGTSLLAVNVLSITPLAIALTLLGLAGVVAVAGRTQGRPWRIPLVVVLSLALAGGLYAFAQAGVGITALSSTLLKAEDSPSATYVAGVLGYYQAAFSHVLGIALGALSVLAVLIVALVRSARHGTLGDAFVTSAVPTACIALIVYAALTPSVAAKDDALRRDAFRMVDDEIGYLKSIPGEWVTDDGGQRDGS